MKTQWTKRATIEFARTLTFIYQNYGPKSVAKVNKQFAKNIKMISKNPYSAPIEISLENEARVYRGLVVNKLNKIIYYIDNDKIYIADIWDTRKNPEDLTNRIKK